MVALNVVSVMKKSSQIPIWLKVVYTLFMAVLVPTYWIKYGLGNFLWFSDLTLIVAYVAVMTEKRLLASMAAICGLALELFWSIDFFGVLLFGVHLTGLSNYMFDASWPLWLRLLSLFHLVLPILLVWLVVRLGYEKRAWPLQTVVAAIVIVASWLLTKPSSNVNWVFSYRNNDWLATYPRAYLMVEFVAIAAVYGMTHRLLMNGHEIAAKRSDPTYLYKVLLPESWKESQSLKEIELSADDEEFIHLATEDQLDRIIEKYWADEPYVVLKLEVAKLPGKLALEANPGGTNKYYHLYNGSIPLEAVVECKDSR